MSVRCWHTAYRGYFPDDFLDGLNARDPGASGATGELLAIYVEPSRWRHGVGTELMGWAMAVAPARGWTAMTLWTIEANAQARSFYERCRWFPDGATKREPFAGHLLTQVRYAWPSAGGQLPRDASVDRRP